MINSLLNEIVELLASLHLEAPSTHKHHDLVLADLVNVWASCLLESLPYPEFVIETLNLVDVALFTSIFEAQTSDD